MLFLGVSYGLMILENKALRQHRDQELYTPSHQIFIYQRNDGYIQELINICICAHKAEGIEIKEQAYNENSYGFVLQYENGDVMRVYQYGAQMDLLTKDQVTNYNVRVFFDNRLPDGAIRASIQQLGLKNYMIGFGLCDNNKKGEE